MSDLVRNLTQLKKAKFFLYLLQLQYEERIKDLELQLSIYQGQMDHVHPHTHAVALERELESVRERYKQQIKDLQAEVDRLTNEANKSKKVHEGKPYQWSIFSNF